MFKLPQLIRKDTFINETALSRRHPYVTYLYSGNLANSRCCILNKKGVTELDTCEKIYFQLFHHLVKIKI